MVVTDDDSIADRCRQLRNLCFQSGRRFVHEELGWNYRMTNLQAAVGLAQLENLDRHVDRKRQIGKRYREQLQDIEGLQLPLSHTDDCENIYWVFGIVVDQKIDTSATQIASYLAAQQIGTRPFFWPMHEQPVFQKMGLFTGDSYPVAERLARQGIYLPTGLGLTDDQIDQVCSAVKSSL